jgi:fibronectin type 3 domain-containing protein
MKNEDILKFFKINEIKNAITGGVINDDLIENFSFLEIIEIRG